METGNRQAARLVSLLFSLILGSTENPLYNKGEADRGGGNTDPSMQMASCTPAELSDLLSKAMNQMTIVCFELCFQVKRRHTVPLKDEM